MKDNTLTRLQFFYLSMCDGEWHREYGIKIDNIGNPGWILEVGLFDTYLEKAPFENVDINRKREMEIDDDWCQCEKKDGYFRGACSPENLEEMLIIFLDWAELSWKTLGSSWEEENNS